MLNNPLVSARIHGDGGAKWLAYFGLFAALINFVYGALLSFLASLQNPM